MYNYYVHYEYKEYIPNKNVQNVSTFNNCEDTIFISIDNMIREKEDIKIIERTIENITKCKVTKIFSFSYMGNNNISLRFNGKPMIIIKERKNE